MLTKKGFDFMNYSDIDMRKKHIMEFIINEYLDSCTPVGSRTISKNSDLGVSAATIRNEMSDLEDLGYLEKAHSSSGRIPSELAYRYYANEVLNEFNAQKSNDKTSSLTLRSEKSGIKGESALNLACDILSESTNSVVISSLERFNQPRIKKLEIINITSKTYVIVFVLDNLEVSSKVFNVDFEISSSDLKKINFLLNKILSINTQDDLTAEELDELVSSALNRDLIQYFLYFINKEYRGINDIKTKVTGLTNVLEMPEYNDLFQLKSFLNLLNNEKQVKKILNKKLNNHIEVFIGGEVGLEELSKNSLVLTELILDNAYKIKLGVLSPLRSDYKKNISSLYNISWKLISL